MNNILERIIENKKREVEAAKEKMPLQKLIQLSGTQNSARSLRKSLAADPGFHFICEIKKASPSKGLIQPDFNPQRMAEVYQQSGAAAISVLTDQKFFSGSLADLKTVRKITNIPVLRKDFIIDPWQIYESKLAGADIILLIARVLSAAQISEFSELAGQLKLDVLFELAKEADADKIPEANTDHLILGINNRNLVSFEVDFDNARKLKQLLPPDLPVIAESGIHTAEDCRKLADWGFRGALIGESLMRSENPGRLLSEMIDGAHREN